MAKQALGIIETKGLTSLIEAADAAVKSAELTLEQKRPLRLVK